MVRLSDTTPPWHLPKSVVDTAIIMPGLPEPAFVHRVVPVDGGEWYVFIGVT